jgi:TolA-binding protein
MSENNFQKSSPEKNISNVEKSEINDLKDKIEQLEQRLEKEQIPVNQEKERLIKVEIEEYLQSLQQTPSFAAPTSVRDETDEIKKFSLNEQVGALISLAFDKGAKKAILVARELDNPAILDEFHGILINRYYNELINKKIDDTK